MSTSHTRERSSDHSRIRVVSEVGSIASLPELKLIITYNYSAFHYLTNDMYVTRQVCYSNRV